MRRRRFVGQALAAGALATPVAAALAETPVRERGAGDDLVERVRRAMLTMQRASWEQGVAAQALLERGDEELAALMAREAVLRQAEDGRLSVLYTDNGVTDPAASGEAVLYAARATGDAELKRAADRMIGYLLERAPRAADGTLHHTVKEPEIWVDSMYMAPPFLAAAGQHREAIRQLDGMGRRLWNPAKRLHSHRWDEAKGVFINASAWGVGNGWAMAGLARVAEQLPGELASERDRLLQRARDTIDGCLAHLRKDALFHNVVDDPGTFVETNLSQMVAYTIFRGIGAGWLERRYLEPALRMKRAARDKVDEHGYVQGVCGAPFFDKPGRATEGQAFFLLMEAAHSRLVREAGTSSTRTGSP
jgi:unsaturated rhamnogalacturonyl hydrolase